MSTRRTLLVILWIALKLTLIIQFSPGDVSFAYEGF